MKMIVGGAFQGKLELALRMTGIDPEQAIDGRDCPVDAIFQAPLIHHFHEYVRRMIQQDEPFMELGEKLLQKNPGIVIVSNELGCGVVPVEPFDRKYREGVGRLCCNLAVQSEEVYRVVCGIGQRIK